MHINMQEIADELDFDLEDVEMLVEVFMSSTQENLKNLKNAVENENFNEIRNIAHSIKGSAANLRLESMRVLAYEIEIKAKNSEKFDYMTGYTKLKDMLEA